jgi:hypothetical protein
MNLTSRRADEFDRLISSGEHTDDPTDAPLLAVTAALRHVAVVPTPRPEFRAQLRQRLVAVAAVQVPETEASPVIKMREATRTWRVQRRMMAAAAGAAVVTAVAGVGVGASRSLPGQPFYGVKKAAEGAQLATTFGTEARGKRHLEFARTRLAEVEALAAGRSTAMGAQRVLATRFVADSGSSSLILSTLRSMDAETRDGANDLFATFGATGSAEPLRALAKFTTNQYDELHTLLPELPASVQDRAETSLALLQLVHSDTASLAGSATSPNQSQPTPGSSNTPAPGSSATATPSSSTQSSTPTTAPPPVTLPTQKSSPVGIPTIGPASVPQPTEPLPSTLPSTLPSVDISSLPGLLGH